jgi:DNA-binding transcriptional ArsR family regulator
MNVFDKSKRREEGKHFVKIPSELVHHYTYHPDFKAEHSYLYAIIVDYYNADEGYAYPNRDTLAMRYGKNPKTLDAHLAKLKGLDLMKVVVREDGKNVYIPLEPLAENDFYLKYPEALEEYKRRLKYRDTERVKAKERMQKFRSCN